MTLSKLMPFEIKGGGKKKTKKTKKKIFSKANPRKTISNTKTKAKSKTIKKKSYKLKNIKTKSKNKNKSKTKNKNKTKSKSKSKSKKSKSKSKSKSKTKTKNRNKKNRITLFGKTKEIKNQLSELRNLEKDIINRRQIEEKIYKEQIRENMKREDKLNNKDQTITFLDKLKPDTMSIDTMSINNNNDDTMSIGNDDTISYNSDDDLSYRSL